MCFHHTNAVYPSAGLRFSVTATRRVFTACSSLTTLPAIKKALTRCKGLDLSVWFVLSFIAMMHGKTAMMYCIYIVCGQCVDGDPHIDRVIILSAFRLLHLRHFVNPIPAGRKAALFNINKFCPLRTKITFDNVYLSELIDTKRSSPAKSCFFHAVSRADPSAGVPW